MPLNSIASQRRRSPPATGNGSVSSVGGGVEEVEGGRSRFVFGLRPGRGSAQFNFSASISDV